ncbi:MAG TPA: sigma-70 family RNA polymerase sigma factor [Phycisphaerae bacterium]|nr:sigma-70 family RNA polymerase sigma factor [Phycisphaerae bacterium]
MEPVDWITTTTVLRDLRDFGNAQAWERFVQRFRRPVVSFGVSMGLTPADAEDAAQDTLAAFAEGFREGKYDPRRGRLSQWLFGIAYRKAADLRRRVGRAAYGGSSAVDAIAADQWPDETTAAVSWDREWEQAVLEQCLAQVQREVEPTTYRAFDLVVRENCDASRAAELLGVNIKLVYNAKHRVLHRIRELRSELECVA